MAQPPNPSRGALRREFSRQAGGEYAAGDVGLQPACRSMAGSTGSAGSLKKWQKPISVHNREHRRPGGPRSTCSRLIVMTSNRSSTPAGPRANGAPNGIRTAPDRFKHGARRRAHIGKTRGVVWQKRRQTRAHSFQSCRAISASCSAVPMNRNQPTPPGIAYCQLPPAERTIAAAYRSIKGKPLDANIKTPGYFGAWAKQYQWKEYAAAWDAYHQGLTAHPEAEQLTAARKETVEQAEQLQALIQQEIEQLKETSQRRRLWPGGSNTDRTADLANLASALKDASAARLAALGGNDPDYE